MAARTYGGIIGALLTAGTVAVGCGGVDEGRINIVDEDAPGGAGGKSSSTAGSGAPGGSAEGGALAGGSGEGGGGPIPVLPEPPVVVSISPDDGATEAEPTDRIQIEFSEGLDPDTVTGDSIQVFDGEELVSGTLDYSGVTVEFTPDRRLDLLTEYSVVVTTAISDLGGTFLEEDFGSSFKVRDGQWSEELVVQNAEGSLLRTLVSPAIDAEGNALVVWGQAKAGETVNSVFGRVFSPGNGFGEAFEIDQADVACDDLSVAMNAEGEAIVAWTEKRGSGEEVWVRRLSSGRLAASAERIDAMAAAVSSTVSAVSITGEAHVFWSFNDTAGGTAQNLLANRAAAGGAWSASPKVIYQYADALSPPAVAFDDDGNGFAFFAFDSDGDAYQGRLYANRYLGTTGQWGSGILIDGSEGARLYEPPSAVTDDQGGARVIFAAVEDVKAVSFSKAGGFSVAAAIDALDTSPQSMPKLSSNGRKFLATWYQSASLTTNAYSAQSSGGAFSPPELRSSGDFQVGYYGTAVSGIDRHGNALVLFEQGNAANTVDIVFGRQVGQSGDWTDGEFVNSLEGQYQDPRVAVAANGVAIAAWSVGIRLSANSIYVSTFE